MLQKRKGKTMKKTTALILALAAVISLSACNSAPKTETGSKPETSTSAPAESTAPKSESTPASESSAPAAESTPAATEATEPAEPEPAAPVADTAYWDLLCEEYDKYYAPIYSFPFIKDGKLTMIAWDNKVKNRYLFSYDTSTKQLEFQNPELQKLGFYLINEKYYAFDSDYKKHGLRFKCYDLNFNELAAQTEPINLGYGNKPENLSVSYINDELGILLYYPVYNGLRYLVSPDLKEVKPLELNIEYDIGHGKTDVFGNYTIKGVYKNKLYLSCSGENSAHEYHIYDLSTGKSEKIDESSNLYSFLNKKCSIGKYGKYCLTEDGILDIETGEIISNINLYDIIVGNNDDFELVGHSMFKTFENEDGKTEIYKFVMPANRSEFAKSDKDYIKEYGTLIYTSETKLDWIVIETEDYALIKDAAGSFLVNLNDGSEVEIVFPN